jgi:nucleoside-diphosphate-sugar epimerase
VQADIRHNPVGKLVRGLRIDTVVHAGLVVDPQQASVGTVHETNVIGTMNLLAACSGADSPVRRLVVKSSTAVYGNLAGAGVVALSQAISLYGPPDASAAAMAQPGRWPPPSGRDIEPAHSGHAPTAPTGVSPAHWCFAKRRRNSAFSTWRRRISTSLISEVTSSPRGAGEFGAQSTRSLRRRPP